MRKTTITLLGAFFLIFNCIGFSGFSQRCQEFSPLFEHPGIVRSYLSVLTGSQDRPEAATWAFLASQVRGTEPSKAAQKAILFMLGGKYEEADRTLRPYLDSIEEAPSDSVGGAGLRDVLPADAYRLLIAGDYRSARQRFVQVQSASPETEKCQSALGQVLAAYLDEFGGASPLFAHFNGGYYNFVRDSLGWEKDEPDSVGYVQACNQLVWLLRMDPDNSARYLELLGDFLSRNNDRFTANYLGGLAYMRASMFVGGRSSDQLATKALYALEAPSGRSDRFNQYRFTQLRKALLADIDTFSVKQAAHWKAEAEAITKGTNPLARFQGRTNSAPLLIDFRDDEPGRLPQMLAKSRLQIEERQNANRRYSEEVDLKTEVKKDKRFNLFAAFLILVIVAAIVFFVRQVRRHSRGQE